MFLSLSVFLLSHWLSVTPCHSSLLASLFLFIKPLSLSLPPLFLSLPPYDSHFVSLSLSLSLSQALFTLVSLPLFPSPYLLSLLYCPHSLPLPLSFCFSLPHFSPSHRCLITSIKSSEVKIVGVEFSFNFDQLNHLQKIKVFWLNKVRYLIDTFNYPTTDILDEQVLIVIKLICFHQISE